jgi:hypothetical protein
MTGFEDLPPRPTARSGKPTVPKAGQSGGTGKASRTPSAKNAGARSKAQPRPDEIAMRAYEIFMARGAIHGSDLDDWLQAESELTRRGRK